MHVVLQCEKHNRAKMMHVFLSEMGFKIHVFSEDWKRVDCAAGGAEWRNE